MTRSHASRRLRRPRGRAGFTLIELLTAVFVFTLGLTAIASLFPIAAFIQRQAFDQTVGLQTGRTLDALVLSRQVDLGKLRGSGTDVRPFEAYYLSEQIAPNDAREWPLRLRAFPQGGDIPLDDRDFFAVPLGQDPDGSPETGDERLFLFLLTRQGDADYRPGDAVVNPAIPEPDEWANEIDNDRFSTNLPPDVDPRWPIPQVVQYLMTDITRDDSTAPAGDPNILEPELGEVWFEVDAADDPTVDRIAAMLSPGDPILTETGQILTVLETDGRIIFVNADIEGSPDAFWYAPPPAPDRASPTLQILVFGSEAIQ